MSKHLIVGGLGGLGRHLQKRLLEQGAAVRVLDRPAAVASIPPHDGSVEVHAYTLGVDQDSTPLLQALQDVETVYSVVTPDVQYGTVREFATTNVQGVQDLLQACQEVGTPNLVYGSSIAVTNHLMDTVNGTEEDPLPPLETYQSHYDVTKRQGEELVLAAANNNPNLRVCALRLGGVLTSPTDYCFRGYFDTPGTIRTAPTKRVDFVSAVDASRAFWQAHQQMEQAAGRAIFVSKTADEQTPTATEIAQHLGLVLEWNVQVVPSWVVAGVMAAQRLQDNVKASLTSNKDDLPGMPPHVFMDIANHEKTFDNSLAKQLLDYEPAIGWREAVEMVAEQYRASL